MICVSVYDCLCIQIYAHIRIYKCMYWGSSKILKASAIVQGEASIYVQGGETWPAASVFLHAMQSKTKASPSPSLSWHLSSSLVLTCDLHWFAVKVCAGVWAGCGGMETQIPFGPLTWKESPIVLLSKSLPGGEVDWLLVTPSILNIRSALGVFCRRWAVGFCSIIEAQAGVWSFRVWQNAELLISLLWLKLVCADNSGNPSQLDFPQEPRVSRTSLLSH